MRSFQGLGQGEERSPPPPGGGIQGQGIQGKGASAKALRLAYLVTVLSTPKSGEVPRACVWGCNVGVWGRARISPGGSDLTAVG